MKIIMFQLKKYCFKHTHFKYSFEDSGNDTAPGVRSLAIKFRDHEWESPLDFVMETGARSPYYNANSINDHLTSITAETVEKFKEYLLAMPVQYVNVLFCPYLPLVTYFKFKSYHNNNWTSFSPMRERKW